MRTIIKYFLPLMAVAASMQGCFDLEEHPYDMLGKDVIYQDEESVKGVLAGIYSVGFNNMSQELWELQEFTADQIGFRSWMGGSYGWDEGKRYELSTQTWSSQAPVIRLMWERCWEAIGLCNSALDDFAELDPAKLGMTREKLDAYVSEVRTKRVYLYLTIYDLWGGALPLAQHGYGEIPGSASADFDEGCRILWNFMVNELDESLALLPVNEVNRMNKAANRLLKARLMLNAQVYIGEDHFDECAEICDEIIAGDWGDYGLATDYRDIYSFDNDQCEEVIFAVANDATQVRPNWYRNTPFMSAAMSRYMTGALITDRFDVWNCTFVGPSYDNSASIRDGGTPRSFLEAPYNDKLGAVYARFDNNDIRKRNFTASGTNWSGMFFSGEMKENYGSGASLTAGEEYAGLPLVFVDQVGTFLGNGRPLEDVMSPKWGEHNSGVRMIRYPYYSQETGYSYNTPDDVRMRLAEVYYMLAECKMRDNDSPGAKNTVDQVRRRYYTGNVDANLSIPGPGFTAFDMDWMLSEWGKEFLCEGDRRRTDLRRFDKFTQGQWWFFGRANDEGIDLPAKRDRKYEWFPLPQNALNTNAALIQNPDYVQ